MIQPKAVLFDFDGTLANTRCAVVRAYMSAIEKELNIQLEPDIEHIEDMLRRKPLEYYQQHYGKHGEKLAKLYAEGYDSDGIQYFEGIPSFLDELKNQGIKVGIVTNKGRVRLLSDLEELGTELSYFDVVVCGDDTVERKPKPEPILKAIDALKLDGNDVIYVGDAPHDVEAAKAAGATAVAVSWGSYSTASLASSIPKGIASNTKQLLKLVARTGVQ